MASSSSEGATLVLLGVPQGTELGIDCKSWQVGPRFRGVKMIPPGLTSSTTARQLWRTNWPEDRPLPLSQTREIILATGRQGRRSGLLTGSLPGPYPYEVMRKWVSLTDRISEEMAKTCSLSQCRVCHLSDVIPELQFTHTKTEHERGLRFLSSPKKTYPPGATPAEITKCSMDLSYALETVKSTDIYMEVPPRSAVPLRGSILKRKDLYLGLIAVLYHPAGEIPPDFLLTLYLKTTSLPPRCRYMHKSDYSVCHLIKKFKAHLTKKFRWDFDSDLDDCEPVVVELPEGVTVD
uniref:Protein AAR2 homolog n=1 Tax=Maylandia zebra TaxID=106582 RepID=A0A3P9CK24_9CICH